MTVIEKECKITEQIVRFFNSSKFKPYNISTKDKWKLPKKTNSDIKSGILYGERIPHNVSLRTDNGENYDVTYLKKIFERMNKALSKPIPLDSLVNEYEFVYPNSYYNGEQKYHLLYKRSLCEDFISKVTCFKDLSVKSIEAVEVFYLLGYVGSGKSTFINYLNMSTRQERKDNEVISVFVEYDEISSESYDSEKNQDYWDDKIYNLLINKIYYSAKELRQPPENLEKDFTSIIEKVIYRNNILIVFDGFDSLSANRIEKINNKYAISAISEAIRNIEQKYKQRTIINKQCKVLFSLRKCTYDSLDPNQKIGRLDADDAYYLPAPSFEMVIEKILSVLAQDKDFLETHMDAIFDIICTTSKRIEKLIKTKSMDESNDIFDNNYRRKLRYISSVIIVMALRVSNRLPVYIKDGNIHDEFFILLKEEIASRAKKHVFLDILLYGINTGYNNHFSDSKEDDNLGALCGFVDNIFCYFEDKIKSPSDLSRKILKLRVLQILHYYFDEEDRTFDYKSVEDINYELSILNINVSVKEIEDILDFLEKSLFIRSTKPYNKKGDFKEGGLMKKGIYFKCSNFGSLLLEYVLPTYSYVTAVAQNTCVPKTLADEIRYKKKSLDQPGSAFFISKDWLIEIIPTTLRFLRLLMTIETSNSYDKEYYIYDKLTKSCHDTIKRILKVDNIGLTTEDKQYIRDKCLCILTASK